MDASSIHSSSYSGPHQIPTRVTTVASANPTSGFAMQAQQQQQQQQQHTQLQQHQQQQQQQQHTTRTTTTTSSYETRVGNPDATSSPTYTLPENAYQTETRKVSSIILETQNVGEAPRDLETRYIDVPVVEERVKNVTRKEIHEIDRPVDKPVIEWVPVIVPKIVVEYVDKVVDVPITEDVIVEKPVKRYVDVYQDVVKEVKVKKPHVVYKNREVPGETIMREVPYDVEQKVEVVRHADREVPVIVAQTVKPVISESDKHVAVDVIDYEPEVIPVDVHVAKPVRSALEAMGQVDVKHRLVNITAGQYNTILKLLNRQMDARAKGTLPYVSEGGQVPMIPERDAQFIMAPADIEIEGWSKVTTRTHHHQTHQQIPASEIVMTRAATQPEEPLASSSVYSSLHDANRARCCAGAPRGATAIQQPTNVVVTHVIHDNNSRASGRVASVQHSHRHHSKGGNAAVAQNSYYEPIDQTASGTHHGSYTELSHPPALSNHPTTSRKFVCC